MTCYTDIDYDSFPIADLDLDLHWIQLPNSVLAARRQAKLLALQQERAKALPKNHKVFLVPPTLNLTPSTPPPRKTSGPSSPIPSISASPSFPKPTAPSASPSLTSAMSTVVGATPSPPTSKCPPRRN